MRIGDGVEVGAVAELRVFRQRNGSENATRYQSIADVDCFGTIADAYMSEHPINDLGGYENVGLLFCF